MSEDTSESANSIDHSEFQRLIQFCSTRKNFPPTKADSNSFLDRVVHRAPRLPPPACERDYPLIGDAQQAVERCGASAPDGDWLGTDRSGLHAHLWFAVD